MANPFNPRRSILDSGASFDTSGMSGLGVKFLGEDQIRLRRAAEGLKNQRNIQNPVSPFGPLKTTSDGLGLGGNFMGMDGFFGALQARENAVDEQGKNFRFDPTHTWGTLKQEPLYTPTWDPTDPRQSTSLNTAALRGLGRVRG